MVRDFIYGGALVAGCALGVTLSVLHTHTLLKENMERTVVEAIATPTTLTVEGYIRYVDTRNRTTDIEIVTPYDPTSKLLVRSTYNDRTSFTDQFLNSVGISAFSSGDRVSINIARTTGTFQTIRLSKL